jgi:hypothetical protein
LKGLQTTLFILAFLALSTQSFRHVYVKWIEPQGSILDEFRKSYEQKMDSTQTLSELKKQYADAYNRFEKKDSELDSTFAGKRSLNEIESEKNRIAQLIRHREERNKDVFELWFFWSCGLLSVIFGVIIYLKLNHWIGMAGLISGFSEMVFWTKPSFRSFGGVPEFEMLLNSKLALSIVTLSILTTLWLLKSKFERIEK